MVYENPDITGKEVRQRQQEILGLISTQTRSYFKNTNVEHVCSEYPHTGKQYAQHNKNLKLPLANKLINLNNKLTMLM